MNSSNNIDARNIIFEFSAIEHWFRAAILAIGATGFLVHGQLMHQRTSTAIGLIALGLLIFVHFFGVRPPKRINLDLNSRTITIENRLPAHIDEISLANILHVKCKVIRARHSVTSLDFVLSSGNKKSYIFEVETSGKFFDWPKENPPKQVLEFVTIFNMHLSQGSM